MGTDIHASIEYRESDGSWKALAVKNPYYLKYGDDNEYTHALNINRDYDLFAILANVRNGTGFAGIITGEGYVPMSDCRGIPEDISPEAREVLSDEHSATWVTLTEILNYDWDRTTSHRGCVNPGVFAEWDRIKEWNPRPKSWSGEVSGGGVKIISNDEMRQAIKLDPTLATDSAIFCKSNLYTFVEWKISYTEDATQMWTKILPKMLNLGKVYGYENVRLVMDFDS